MAVTVSQFRTDFPEFTDAPDTAVIQRCLNSAALLTGGLDTSIRDLATEYYAAHLITRDPRGEPTAMEPYGNMSTVKVENIQKGNRAERGVDQYLAAYQDLLAAYVIPVLVS